MIRLLAVFWLTFTLGSAHAAAPTLPRALRVLTYNIHHGEGVDGRLELTRLAGIISASAADVVALQEVDRKATRTQGIDQAAELAEHARAVGLGVRSSGAGVGVDVVDVAHLLVGPTAL